MQKTLFHKLMIISLLMALIAIPLAMIHGTITERMNYHAEAVRTIAADSVREQSLVGPLLVIPYTEEFEVETPLPGDSQKTRIEKRTINRRHLVFPNGMNVDGAVATDHRYRGIHKVLVYTGKLKFDGDFVMPPVEEFKRKKGDSRITIGKPFVALSVADVRGIKNIPSLHWDGKPIEFAQGSDLHTFKDGLHAPIILGEWKPGAIAKFRFELNLDGIERLHMTPVAKNNVVRIQSAWPHPQFGGQFLPLPSRKITDTGFDASWNIAAVASNAQSQLRRLETTRKQEEETQSNATPAVEAKLDVLSVGFIEPVNIYSQADRAVKYGLLFVALTFAAFFLFEVLKRLPIHPVQYALVGLALVLFFLLLLSLSEHITFGIAYLVASSACILLIGFYLANVLRDWKRGFGFGAGLTLLYGVLFGLLRSENNALVMGSILLFGLLSAVMIATRKVDWYQVGRAPDAA